MADKNTMEKCYTICTKKGGFALAVENASADSGALVRLKAIDGSDAQKWTAVAAGEYVKLVNKCSGKVLDVVHAGCESGCAVHQWDDAAGSDSQLWRIVLVKSGRSKLLNKLSGKCLDVAGMAVGDDALLQIWDDVDGENQKWLFAEEGAPKAVKKAPAKKAAEQDTESAAPKKAAAKKAVETTPVAKKATSAAQAKAPAKKAAPKAPKAKA